MYYFKLFDNLLRENGIIYEISAPRTSQQNGIVEWKNRILKKIMNVMFLNLRLFNDM